MQDGGAPNAWEKEVAFLVAEQTRFQPTEGVIVIEPSEDGL